MQNAISVKMPKLILTVAYLGLGEELYMFLESSQVPELQIFIGENDMK